MRDIIIFIFSIIFALNAIGKEGQNCNYNNDHAKKKRLDQNCAYDEAIELIKNEKNYTKAYELLQYAAKHNNYLAMKKLAQLCEKGYGTKSGVSDYFCIEKWIIRAERKGFKSIINDSNSYLLHVEAVKAARKGDNDKAHSIWFKLSEKGFAPAFRMIGNNYSLGLIDGKRDFEKAILYYKRGVEYGDAMSAYMMGLVYLSGNMGGIQKQKYLVWLKKAFDMGSAKAAYDLARLYDEGSEITGINIDLAYKYYSYAAERGVAKAPEYLKRLKIIGNASFENDVEIFMRDFMTSLSKSWSLDDVDEFLTADETERNDINEYLLSHNNYYELGKVRLIRDFYRFRTEVNFNKDNKPITVIYGFRVNFERQYAVIMVNIEILDNKLSVSKFDMNISPEKDSGNNPQTTTLDNVYVSSYSGNDGVIVVELINHNDVNVNVFFDVNSWLYDRKLNTPDKNKCYKSKRLNKYVEANRKVLLAIDKNCLPILNSVTTSNVILKNVVRDQK